MAKARFTQQTVRRQLDAAADRIDKAIIRRLQYLGETLVNHARENGSYIDQTGNLRSSLGAVVIQNGLIISTDFKTLNGGAEGTRKAKEFADKMKSKYPKGYCLLIVAGMGYAQVVEVLRGRNVLSLTEMEARSLVPRVMSELKANIERMPLLK